MNQEDKLKVLKDILLTDEREYASSIHKKIKILEETVNKKNNLSEKVDPIIEDRLQEFIKEIPKTLGPTITETLKSEIKNSQDAVVEAMYPILGRMIKKYIQNEIQVLSEKINQQLNNTFSFKNLKRKIKSKMSGVSEADLIINELQQTKLNQFLVIEKGSGLLISKYSKTDDIDEEMVAGMLTAIKSFVEDAFKSNNQELELINYETYSIYIQNFSSYYIAVAISGVFQAEHRSKLEDKLLDFAQNVINKTDLKNTESLTKKLKAYFSNEFI
ncbi:cell envelope biogenesis protein OmpA [Oceanihabitans sediminis]|uniref:Cell envelope biogenesis protein OmpA n=1 Tax=Oceanihabitans sediminis TaxID=1812012 RepID=A0A368P5K3_9FLAO|nr:cell envelope biogenesis protein OmpA [Oceanihabitans sediminis]MDX1277478.1 cell envelope biogenesis protein OmpA [Oceanihabitans sediminis]RBP34497.1 hypothetical protein DFR65_101391 [Oceanihabitans sediminis]RCU58167.1 cell envelope biogenesis protein OmpA [Oceanihabitans sediminis]